MAWVRGDRGLRIEGGTEGQVRVDERERRDGMGGWPRKGNWVDARRRRAQSLQAQLV